jgi:hypothetical protein
MDDTLETLARSLEDDELNRILTVDSAQYRDEMLTLARAEAARRGLSVTAPEAREGRESTVGAAVRALADGIATAFRPGRFTAAGKRVTCAHCAGDQFESRPAVVNTRAFTFIGLDWLDRGATVLVCEACGLLAWFRVAPERVRDQAEAFGRNREPNS